MADINNAEVEDEEEKPKLTLEKGDSVYSYAIFLPPIIYHQKGTLHNYEMFLGIVLLCLNLAMQVGLTYVVGQGVLEDGNAWRASLVGMGVDDQIEEGQVKKDSKQLLTLPVVGINGWRSDPNYFGHILEEAQSEFGLRNRKASDLHHKAQLGLIEELKNEVAEEEAAVKAFKTGFRTSTGKSFRAGETPYEDHMKEAASRDEDKASGKPDVHLAAAGKPMKGGKKGGGDDVASSAKFCSMENATYSCLPPSVKYASRWELLDTNGDGIWSREEAEKDENKLEKKTKAKPFLVFRAITVGLIDRQKYDKRLWVEPNGMMAKMEGVPKAYFDYWMGDAALCSYADPGMCSTLLSRGFFNEAMNPKHPGKEIPDIDGALDYCTYMLKVGGGCDQSLPQIYKLYRAARHEQCGDGHFFAGGLHKNPYHETDRVYVIANVYANLQKFLKANSTIFQVFLFLVLMLWLLALTNEMREMIKLAEFTYVFPAVEGDLGLEIEKDEDGNETYTITGISREHRMVVAFMCATRIIVIIYLGAVGCVFLVNEVGYMDLLMNAVALAFILEVDEILFGAVARHSTIEALEALNDVEFETRLPTEDTWAGWILQKDFWSVILFPIIAYLLIMTQTLFVTNPILDALNCGCYQLGSQCRDAQYYNLAWWNDYWSITLPNALEKIAEFKAGAGA